MLGQSCLLKWAFVLWTAVFWAVFLFFGVMGLFMKGPVWLSWGSDPYWNKENPPTLVEQGCLAFFTVGFVYGEGYRAFQLSWAPMLAQRTFDLAERFSNRSLPPLLYEVLFVSMKSISPPRLTQFSAFSWYSLTIIDLVFLAPLYAGAFLYGDVKRIAKTWIITLIIFAAVKGIMSLPQPWHAIADTSVCAGLFWGYLATIFFFINYMCGCMRIFDNKVLAYPKNCIHRMKYSMSDEGEVDVPLTLIP